MRAPALDVVVVPLARDGRVLDAHALDRLAALGSSATDCVLFCHGWLYDAEEARVEAHRFFALLEAALRPLGERVAPVRLALHWPSKPFAGKADARNPSRSGLWPELGRRLHPPTRWTDLVPLLMDLAGTEVPLAPEEEMELDALLRRLRSGPARGGAPSPFQALSFWVMKRRAGEVGERFGREWLAPLWRNQGRAPRLHLVGHSFGAKLVTSMVLGGVRPESLVLLLAAFSAFAFAPDVPGAGRPGFYHRVLADRLVSGPIAVLRSQHDRALGLLYRAITGTDEVDRHRRQRPERIHTHRADSGRPVAARQHNREVVAASALGAVGARGVAAPEIELGAVQRIGLPQVPIVNVDGSRVVAAREGLMGAHRDIYHAEIATLVLLAAGLLEPGPDGPRAARLTPAVWR